MNQNAMVGHSSVAGYSSRVQLSLETGGAIYPLSHTGPNFVRLREATSIPPGKGVVVMVVDGTERRWPVSLPNGAVPFDANVETEDC
jgi:hypothetical protein